ncbi:hypothetical protein DL93DRAFT_2080511 [Clavulina sp. PMI_390]|nr:hypothetical protein DL93DRAFT_2080511 [Clavulina sp. PMI_390]
MSKVKDDPRDASLSEPSTLPPHWRQEASIADVFASSSMMLGGLTMVTRNPFVGWFTLLFGLWFWLNSQPLRTKESASNPGQGTLIAAVALIASYFPQFVTVG